MYGSPAQTAARELIVALGALSITIVISSKSVEEHGASLVAVKRNVTNPLAMSAALNV